MFLYPIRSKSVNPVNACRKVVDDVYVGLRQFTPMNTFGEINGEINPLTPYPTMQEIKSTTRDAIVDFFLDFSCQ